MQHAKIIEKVLRSSVLTVLQKPDFALDRMAFDIKTVAKERLSQLSTCLSTRDFDLIQSEAGTIINNLIYDALKKIQIISNEKSDRHTRRASFESERSAGVISFSLPINKQKKQYSAEDSLMYHFINIVEKNEAILYFGLVNTNQFSIALPLFKLRVNHHIHLNATPAENACETTNNYFDTLLCENLSMIDYEFSKENSFEILCESIIENENYLKDRRLIEIIITSVSNGLWFLMNPVTREGAELSVSERVKLCNRFLAVFHELNQELGRSKLNQKDTAIIFNVLKNVIERVKQFKAAFFLEHKSDLSLSEVSVAIQHSLNYLNRGAVSFLFEGLQSFNTLNTSKGSYGNELITTIISNMVSLMVQDKNSLKIVEEKLASPPTEEPVANHQVKTVIDVLIYFTHATPSKKKKLFDALAETPNLNRQSFYKLLFMLNESYIEPAYNHNEALLDIPFWDKNRHKKVAYKTARELVPIFCMVIETCQIELEPNFSGLNSEENQVSNISCSFRQHEKIKRMHDQDNSYYDWGLVSFCKKQDGVVYQLHQLPLKVKRFLNFLKFNDVLAEAINKNELLLSDASTLAFIKDFMKKIVTEYERLEENIVIEDSHLKQEIYEIVEEIKIRLEKASDSISILMEQEPSLRYQSEAEELQLILDELNHQHMLLFERETGIKPFASQHIPVMRDIELLHVSNIDASIHMAISLCNVIRKCQGSLSPFFSGGFKEQQLQDLYNTTSQTLTKKYKSNTSQAHKTDLLKQISQELARVALTSRALTCSFFQTTPGQSNTAMCLYREVKKSRFDDEFPLARLLLGDDFMIHGASEEDICLAMQEKYLYKPETSVIDEVEATPIV